MGLKALAILAAGTLPPTPWKNLLLRALGWQIGSDVVIGSGLYLNVAHVELQSKSSIGFGNVVRDVARFYLGQDSVIGQWNWISAARPLVAAGAPGSLSVGRESAITSRHYIDASGGVWVGDFTILAGVRSTIISHGIRWRDATQRTKPVRIGNFCLIGSNNQITPGCSVEDSVVTGMGTTLTGHFGEGQLVVGGRGAALRSNLTGLYFTRIRGWVPAGDAVPQMDASEEG